MLMGDRAKYFGLIFGVSFATLLMTQQVSIFMVTPKQSLTGDNTERVDTRVLKMIYHVAGSDQALYVGQQLDVFLNAGQDTAGSDIAQNVPSP
jgi:hypothetical protein